MAYGGVIKESDLDMEVAGGMGREVLQEMGILEPGTEGWEGLT